MGLKIISDPKCFWLIVLFTCLETCLDADPFTSETQLYYKHNHSLNGKSLNHNKFLASRVPLYPNSSVSFQIELLICGDIELNPGPPPSNKEHSNPNTRKYDNSELYRIGTKCFKLPVSPTTWATIKSLGIKGMQTHRGFRGGRNRSNDAGGLDHLQLKASTDLKERSSLSTKTAKQTPKHPCVSCERGVVSRSRAVSCDICDNWTHARCSGSISEKLYDHLVAENINFSFICNKCLINSLPYNVHEYNDHNSVVNDCEESNRRPLDVNNDIFDCLRTKGFHCVHINMINARSLPPKISELKILAFETKVSIIAISEHVRAGLTTLLQTVRLLFLGFL